MFQKNPNNNNNNSDNHLTSRRSDGGKKFFFFAKGRFDEYQHTCLNLHGMHACSVCAFLLAHACPLAFENLLISARKCQQQQQQQQQQQRIELPGQHKLT